VVPRGKPGPRAPHGARQGLTSEQVAARYASQGGRCQVCGDPMQLYFADHDHSLAAEHGHAPERGCPRCFRALLCPRCNTVVGLAADDPTLLDRAAAYLRAWAAQVRRA